MTSETLSLAKKLINIESITPNDNGCQDLLINQLEPLGFTVDKLPYGNVSNVWARYGTKNPLFVFAGHTDVVPPGPEHDWISPPFSATLREGALYGRGAADMKSAIAAMSIACKRFLKKHPKPKGSIAFLITSDEEGEAINGTRKVVEYLEKKAIKMDWCLVGEATSNHRLGDVIKVGRRGSLHGFLQVIGKQGHIAYPQQADNPIHRCFKALDTLTHMEWDQGNAHFTPTSFQIYNIQADTGASNIIPGSLTAKFNFRYAPSSTADALKKRVHQVFDEHHLNYNIEWNLSSQPFLSQNGQLTEAVKSSIQSICQIETDANTTGGTSDGRFIAPTGTEVVELGPSSESIHQTNEHITTDSLETLTDLYEDILNRLLT